MVGRGNRRAKIILSAVRSCLGHIGTASLPARQPHQKAVELKARNVIARPEGPGIVLHDFSRGLKGRHNPRATDVPPLQGGGKFVLPTIPALQAGLSHDGPSALRRTEQRIVQRRSGARTNSPPFVPSIQLGATRKSTLLGLGAASVRFKAVTSGGNALKPNA